MDETELHNLLEELKKHLDRIEEIAQIIGDDGDKETEAAILKGLQIIDEGIVNL